MSARPSLLRRVAIALMNHAAAVLPSWRASWAEAMRNELQHIENDGEAVMWAGGCVFASYVERSNVAALLDTWFARVLLAILIGRQVVAMLFASVLTAAYKLGYLGVAALLGGFTPGDDYRRFIPLMEATPWWIHALWLTAALLFLASGWELLRRRRTAFLLFAAAWICGALGNLLGQSIPEYRQAFSFSAPLFTRDYLIPIASALLPVFIAAALWAHGRCTLENEHPG